MRLAKTMLPNGQVFTGIDLRAIWEVLINLILNASLFIIRLYY